MTTASSTTTLGWWWRLLLAAVAAALVALLGAGTASAATLTVAETRVGPSTAAGQLVVGVADHITAGQQWGNAPPEAVSVVGRGVAANGGARLIRPPLAASPKQVGTKWGKHAGDYGYHPGDSAGRAWYSQRIRDVHRSPDEVRRGPYNPHGGGGDGYFFFRRGGDLVITKPDGEFVSMFPGSNNAWFKNAQVFD